MEFVDEHGEIHNDEDKSALQKARSELAGFKFKLLKTVGADRLLRARPCLEVMLVMSDFMTIDKRTLLPTVVYASANTIMASSRVRSKTTVRNTLLLMERHGYLVRTGSSTKDGCAKYRIANPHYERVAMSIRDAREHYAHIEAEKSRVDRERRTRKQRDVSKIDASGNERPAKNCAVVVSKNDTNYLGGYLSSLGSGKEATTGPSLAAAQASYGEIPDLDPDEPFPTPQTDDELASAIADFVTMGFSPAVVGYFKLELLAGRLTPAMVDKQRRLAA